MIEQLKVSKELTLTTVLDIMRQILSVISMMHGERLAHRAIRPNHIMLEEKKDGSFFVKVIDFSSTVNVDQKKYKVVKPSLEVFFNLTKTSFNSNETKTNPF